MICYYFYYYLPYCDVTWPIKCLLRTLCTFICVRRSVITSAKVVVYACVSVSLSGCLTRKLCYFCQHFHGLLFWFTLWMCLQNLKSVALPDPAIIGVPQKVGSPWICLRSLFSKFLTGFSSDASYECNCQISFTCSWVNRVYPKIGAVSGYAHTRGGHRGSGIGWYRSKGRWWVPIGRP